MHLHKLLLLLLIRELSHELMILAVVSECVPCLDNLLHIIRIGLNPASRGKKGNLDIVLIKNIKNLLCVLVAPGGSYSDGNLSSFLSIVSSNSSSHIEIALAISFHSPV